MIKVIIVEDEPLAQDVMVSYVEKIPNLKLVGTCSNVFEANSVLSKETVDLMLLDIKMPQMSGIEFLKTLDKKPKVIFTTAFPNYAVEGFELDAVDYLLKPISLERFMKAINKVTSQLGLEQAGGAESKPEADFFFVKADKKLIKVMYNDILYVEGLKDYVMINLESRSKIVTLQTMKSLEKKLPAHLFQRIHRSFIVAIPRITAVIGNMVEIKEKGAAKHIPIGKNYRDEVLKIINKNRL